MTQSSIFLAHDTPIVQRVGYVVVFLIGILLMPSAEILSQTFWTSLPRPTYHNLRTLSFLDSLKGWAAGDSGTILRTTDGSRTWVHQNSGITKEIDNIFMVNERRGWAIAIDTTRGTIVLSTTNGGDAWHNQPWVGEYFTSIYFSDSLVGWLGSASGRMVRTTNGGLTWTELGQFPFPILNVKFFSPVYGFAMGGRWDAAGVMSRTTNAGVTWTAQSVAPDPVQDLHCFDSLDIMGIFGGADFVGIITTGNGGNTWATRSLSIPGQPLALAVRTHAEVWAPLGDARTYMYSLDSGATWTSLTTPDTTEVYDAVFTDEHTGYMVGSGGTVLKYSLVTSIGEHQQSYPLQFVLHQNYPNPFNPATVIRYTLPVTSFVNLKVYNVLGQEVATLVNEEMKPGSYDVTWEASNLSSGVYFYRLAAGNFVNTKKLIVLE